LQTVKKQKQLMDKRRLDSIWHGMKISSMNFAHPCSDLSVELGLNSLGWQSQRPENGFQLA